MSHIEIRFFPQDGFTSLEDYVAFCYASSCRLTGIPKTALMPDSTTWSPGRYVLVYISAKGSVLGIRAQKRGSDIGGGHKYFFIVNFMWVRMMLCSNEHVSKSHERVSRRSLVTCSVEHNILLIIDTALPVVGFLVGINDVESSVDFYYILCSMTFCFILFKELTFVFSLPPLLSYVFVFIVTYYLLYFLLLLNYFLPLCS